MDTAMDGLTDRLDGFGLGSSPSTTLESSLPPFNAFSGFPSPIRSPFQPTGAGPPASMGTANGGIDIPSIPRRFTTDVGKFPWGGAFHGNRGASVSVLPDISSSLDFLSPGVQQASATTLRKSQLYEKKLQHIEKMRQQRRQLEADMKMFDLQQEREQQELNQLAQDLAQAQQAQHSLNQYQIQPQKNGHQQQQQQQQQARALNSSGSSAFSSASASAFSSGNASEPTTPPLAQQEPSVEDSRGFPSSFSRPRFSTSSLSSTGWFNPFGSPPNQKEAREPAQPKPLSSIGSGHGSSLSSRRNSDDEAFVPDPLTDYRPSVSFNRYSMPVSGLSTKLQATAGGGSSFPSTLGLGSFNQRKHVFAEESPENDSSNISTPEVTSYLKMTDPDERSFPTLKSDRLSGLLSANPVALDLANSPTPVPQPEPERSIYRRTAYNRDRAYHQSISLPSHSLGFLGPESTGDRSTRPLSTDSTQLAYDPFIGNQTARPRQQPSLSSFNRTRAQTTINEGSRPVTPPRGRRESVNITSPVNGGLSFRGIPFSPEADRRQSSVTFIDGPGSPISARDDVELAGSQPLSSSLQASAAPFGPSASSFTPAGSAPVTSAITSAVMQSLQLAQQQQQPAQSPPVGFGMNMPAFQTHRSRGSNAGRRADAVDSAQYQRYSNNVPLEHYVGDIYTLCKDQHGCRYLQRKLEEKNGPQVQMIFEETYMHVVDLMTDPFGNYLCQKLLEYSTDDQRTVLINNAAPQLVQIALNQHGTRALQKMIEFVSTREQIETVIMALRDRVVELVKDLNGNHVIQKCLNHLAGEDAQFIYEAVGTNCIEVGTHRHGCCVLQRCIDHASGNQKARLIEQITANAFSLVQDPFGNYVVQYILDLQEPHFIEPVCRMFQGKIAFLSKQKFSSNVIEKCIRTADQKSCRMMIEEMVNGSELERMLRDSFANYVVQTAIEYADPDTRVLLLNGIRPILPSIRATPHGRRIANKMMSLESQHRPQNSSSSSTSTVNANKVSNHDGNKPSVSSNGNNSADERSPLDTKPHAMHAGMNMYQRPFSGYQYTSPTQTHSSFADFPSSFSSEAPSALTARSVNTPSNTSISSADGSPQSGPLSVSGMYGSIPIQGASGLNSLPGAEFLYSRS